MSVLLRVVAALAAMLVLAAIVFVVSRGHVFFFPLVLLLGVPFWWAARNGPRDRR